MLPEDKETLKRILMEYPAKMVMRELSGLALEVAGEVSDAGAKEMAKDYVQFSVALEDLTSGRPFLV